MSLNTKLATAPNTSDTYILKASGTTIGNSIMYQDSGGGMNVAYSGTTGGARIRITPDTPQGYIEAYDSGGGFYKLVLATGGLSVRNGLSTSLLEISTSGAATFSSSVTATQGIFAAQNGNSSDYNYLIFNNLESGYGDWNFYKIGSNDLGIGYGTSAGSSYTNAMTIKYGGNVGIGNTNPSDYYNTILAIGNPSSAATGFTMSSTSTGASAIWFARSDSGAGRYRASFAYNQSDDNFYWRLAGDALRMTLTGGGNLGIGVTPSAWDTTIFKGLQVANSNAFLVGRVDAASQLQMGTNTYYNADGNWKFIQNGYATRYIQNSGVHSWEYSNASGTAGNNVTFNEAMRITETGNIGIGTIAPQSILNNYSTNARGMVISNSYPFLGFNDTDGGNFYVGTQANIGYVWNAGSDALILATNNAEKMRITSGGVLQIGGTNAAPWSITSGTVSQISLNDPTYPFAIAKNDSILAIFNRVGSNGVIMEFKYNGSVVGSISTNANSLPSDRNFKKDITDISLGLNLVNKLRPVHYRHKLDNNDEALSNGIIAQELEQSLLECGVEKNSLLMLQHKPNEKENESQYWVDYTKMIPILIKSIQELTQKVNALENK
jgi:hypothetical protein